MPSRTPNGIVTTPYAPSHGRERHSPAGRSTSHGEPRRKKSSLQENGVLIHGGTRPGGRRGSR
jgi:hypothetical protein